MPRSKAQPGERDPNVEHGGEERGARGGAGTPANVDQGIGAGAGGDEVPLVLPAAAREGHAALQRPEHGQEARAPAGEAGHGDPINAPSTMPSPT
nr:unnamed protein product [Digitaria exilis]